MPDNHLEKYSKVSLLLILFNLVWKKNFIILKNFFILHKHLTKVYRFFTPFTNQVNLKLCVYEQDIQQLKSIFN